MQLLSRRETMINNQITQLLTAAIYAIVLLRTKLQRVKITSYNLNMINMKIEHDHKLKDFQWLNNLLRKT
jgi:hypothetical protein